MKILVLEGAQGGGKSHLYNYLIKTYKNIIPAKPTTTIPRPRSMVDSVDQGAYLSLMTDLDWLLTALKKDNTYTKEYIYLIDRHVISQWVYSGIDEPQFVKGTVSPHLGRMWQSWRSMVSEVVTQYFSRTSSLPTMYINYHFAFYQPSLEELMNRRSHDISKYPFDPRKELHRYEVAADTMKLYNPVEVYTEEMTEEEIGEDIHATLLGLQPIKRNLSVLGDGEGT